MFTFIFNPNGVQGIWYVSTLEDLTGFLDWLADVAYNEIVLDTLPVNVCWGLKVIDESDWSVDRLQYLAERDGDLMPTIGIDYLNILRMFNPDFK